MELLDVGIIGVLCSGLVVEIFLIYKLGHVAGELKMIKRQLTELSLFERFQKEVED